MRRFGGGHLAGSLTIAHDDPVHAPIDAADKQSVRPAFSGLVHPVTNIAATNRGGPGQPDGPMAVYRRDNVPTRVTSQTPPVFLAHSFDDPVVPIDQSLEMVAACRCAKVPVEAHLFERGGLGWGGGCMRRRTARSASGPTFSAAGSASMSNS